MNSGSVVGGHSRPRPAGGVGKGLLLSPGPSEGQGISPVAPLAGVGTDRSIPPPEGWTWTSRDGKGGGAGFFGPQGRNLVVVRRPTPSGQGQDGRSTPTKGFAPASKKGTSVDRPSTPHWVPAPHPPDLVLRLRPHHPSVLLGVLVCDHFRFGGGWTRGFTRLRRDGRTETGAGPGTGQRDGRYPRVKLQTQHRDGRREGSQGETGPKNGTPVCVSVCLSHPLTQPEVGQGLDDTLTRNPLLPCSRRRNVPSTLQMSLLRIRAITHLRPLRPTPGPQSPCVRARGATSTVTEGNVRRDGATRGGTHRVDGLPVLGPWGHWGLGARTRRAPPVPGAGDETECGRRTPGPGTRTLGTWSGP